MNVFVNFNLQIICPLSMDNKFDRTLKFAINLLYKLSVKEFCKNISYKIFCSKCTISFFFKILDMQVSFQQILNP